MKTLPWLSEQEALDLLRTGSENLALIESLSAEIPQVIEHTTGYPARFVESYACDETAKLLAKFMLQLWYAPDGIESDRQRRTIESLTHILKRRVQVEQLDKHYPDQGGKCCMCCDKGASDLSDEALRERIKAMLEEAIGNGSLSDEDVNEIFGD